MNSTSRIDVIGQNGNTGEHYEEVEVPSMQSEGHRSPLPTGGTVQSLSDALESTTKESIPKERLIRPERQEGETQEEYRSRRWLIKFFNKMYLRGRMFWDSNNKGTYVKSKKA